MRFTSAALSLLPLLALARPSEDLEERACGTLIAPTNFYQIFEGPAYARDGTVNLGSTFSVAEYADPLKKQDLVVSFKNVPCPPAGRGPYEIKFAYPGGAQTSGNTKINVFAINGDLPQSGGSEAPSFNNLAAQTGSLIGTFTFPTNGASASLYINSVVCKPTINLRFSIADPNGNTPAGVGSVSYSQNGAQGLQILYGC